MIGGLRRPPALQRCSSVVLGPQLHCSMRLRRGFAAAAHVAATGDAAWQREAELEGVFEGLEGLPDSALLRQRAYEKYAERRRQRIMDRDAERLTPEEVQRRAKIGSANKGRVPWNKGKKHSPGADHATGAPLALAPLNA